MEWTMPASRAEVFQQFQDVAGYDRWMRDVRRVHVVDDRRSVWSLHGPMGPVEWRSEITIQRPHSMFAWCMEGPGAVGFARVHLREHGRGTRVKMERFLGAQGHHKAHIERWWGEPQARLQADLAHLQGRLEALEDQGAGRPNAVGFNFRASAL